MKDSRIKFLSESRSVEFLNLVYCYYVYYVYVYICYVYVLCIYYYYVYVYVCIGVRPSYEIVLFSKWLMDVTIRTHVVAILIFGNDLL